MTVGIKTPARIQERMQQSIRTLEQHLANGEVVYGMSPDRANLEVRSLIVTVKV